MEVFCLVEPKPGSVYFMGCECLSVSRGQKLFYSLTAGSFYDCCLQHIHPDSTRRSWIEQLSLCWHRFGGSYLFFSAFFYKEW